MTSFPIPTVTLPLRGLVAVSAGALQAEIQRAGNCRWPDWETSAGSETLPPRLGCAIPLYTFNTRVSESLVQTSAVPSGLVSALSTTFAAALIYRIIVYRLTND